MKTTIVPDIREIVNLSFCQDKDQYLQFIREWRELYRLLSNEIRMLKLMRRGVRSELAAPSNKKSRRLLRIAYKLKCAGATPEAALAREWIDRQRFTGEWIDRRPFTGPHGRSLMATRLIEMRTISKMEANEGWKKQHLAHA